VLGTNTRGSTYSMLLKHQHGSIEKHKARFVMRGFSQKEGVDYEKTFALVAEYTSIRVVISITS
jgi:hypothetical protein